MKKILLGVTLTMLFSMVAEGVTLQVKVPEGTKKCYVCGAFNNWDASAAPAMESAGQNLFSLDMPDVTQSSIAQGYKYLCGQDWLYVEKDASGEEISNRTAPGSPDVVGSWRSIPEWGIETAELVINGISRQIKVYLPEGYDNSTEKYPVIYYNTVQQRYSNAGDDGDCGDYFFGSYSWNAQSTMESLRQQGGPAYIMVQVCSYPAENTIAPTPDLAGSGKAAAYLKDFTGKLIPYVESNWRVKTGSGENVIVGADYGALFAIYAAVKSPALFGRCVAMSPMLWINKSEMLQLATEASAGQKFYISAGSLEPQWMRDDASELTGVISEASAADGYYTLYNNASHNDDSWGASFPSMLEAVSSGSASVARVRSIKRAVTDATAFSTAVYTLYAGPDAANMDRIGTFTYTEDYRKKGTSEPVKAQVIVNDIPVSYKSKYYWNIACGSDKSDGWLLASPGDIGFSSKKNAISWHSIAIFENGSTENTAAHSEGFRVVTAKETLTMKPVNGHTSSITVRFPGEDKSFKVHFGSVNSASDMGSLTPTLSVSENCIEAEILYDFELNKVTVNETQYGENLDNVKVTSFSVVPATTTAGSEVNVDLVLSADCNVGLTATRNSTENLGLTFTKTAPGQYHLAISNVKEGIYTFDISLISGENRLDNAATVNLRVLAADDDAKEKEISINPYKDVDWATTNRYKANFHTHTSRSFDTNYTTTQVVDRYKAVGYSILALTDHDANPYPWTLFDLYTADAQGRDPESMNMLAIPGNELSKDRRNNWSETTGGEFNHHTDLFTGRQGQEFMSLRESYAYTEALGGLQIINHPGQYWNLSNEYAAGEKNSPQWHAENFKLYNSLVGLEVYNQGNRRPNDRILWDQILTLTMPERPVWGYSCDDTHTSEQYFRNYQYMLMPDLNTDDLKEAMRNGHTVFSYEYTGTGNALPPHVKSISVDDSNHLITIDSDDADKIEWISSYHRTGSAASTAKSTVVGMGKNFNYTGFQGSYVRALLTNKHGETAVQPFAFAVKGSTNSVENISQETPLSVVNEGDAVTVRCSDPLQRITVVNAAGMVVKFIQCDGAGEVTFTIADLEHGVYIMVAAGSNAAYTHKFVVR